MSEKNWLRLILALFVALGLSYALLTPAFEASDELWHYPMIRHLADGNPLPVQAFDPALAGPWKQEASQPPLYYYLGAALTFWIDASDMETVRWENPHVDNGLLTVDGNNNLTIKDPAWSQWQGALLAVRVVRLFSVLLGLATVYLTYLIAKEVVPTRPELALGATAVTAFLPMFLFISGAVNNDNLIITLAALALLVMIRIVRNPLAVNRKPSSQDREPTTDYGLPITAYRLRITDNWQTWLTLGLIIGLAALTKISGVGLLALAWGTAVLAAYQSSITNHQSSNLIDWLLRGTGRWLLVVAMTLLVAGWWYYRNIVLYDDWRGWSAFIAVLGERAQPASIAQLWGERRGFMMSFWGLFGGVNVPMPMWIYTVLNSVLVVSVVGFVGYAGLMIKDLRLKGPFSLQSLIINLFSSVVQNFPLVICLLWSAAIVYGLVDWATTTWSSQGRLVFSALPALSVLMVLGLAGWLPQRWARWPMVALSGFMFVVAAAAPWLWIAPTYQPDSYYPPRFFVTNPVRADFGDTLRLTGVAVLGPDLRETAVSPGDTVDVIFTWDVLAETERNWSVFVHLNDPVIGVPIAQRDMFHGQGLRPTSLLNAGEQPTTFYRLTVPETAVSPATLNLTVGLYDFYTGERLLLDSGNDAIVLAQIPLRAREGEYPNAASVNFENEIELLGYELNPRRAPAGDTLSATVYVRALRDLTTDYTLFAQIVAADTTRYAAVDLSLPTSGWPAGEVQTIDVPLALAADTPPDVYPLILGFYTVTDSGEFRRLQLVAEDGRIMQDNNLLLTLVRVD